MCERFLEQARSGKKNEYIRDAHEGSACHGKPEPPRRWFLKNDFMGHYTNKGHVRAQQRWDRELNPSVVNQILASSPATLGAGPAQLLLTGSTSQMTPTAGVSAAANEATSQCMPVFRAVMWLAREQVALTKISSLMDLLKESGVPVLHHGYGTYSNPNQAQEMVSLAATEISAAQMHEIRLSRFISWSADGTTDKSISHFLIIFVFWVHHGVLKSGFLKLVACGGDAVSIFIAVCRSLGSCVRNRVVSAATDGASVMIGVVTNGEFDTSVVGGQNVCAFFLRRIPYFSAMHCVAHCSALVGESAAAGVPLLLLTCEGIQSIYTFLVSSYKRRQIHAEIKEAVGEPQIKVKNIHLVRWLSRAGAFTAAAANIVSDILLIQTLAAAETESVATKSGSATSILDNGVVNSISFLLGVPVLAAVLTLHSRFNKQFQGKMPISDFAFFKARFLRKLGEIQQITFECMGSYIINLETKQTLQSMLDKIIWKPDHALFQTDDMSTPIKVPAERGRGISATKTKNLRKIHEGVQSYCRLLCDEVNLRWSDDALTLWSAFSIITNVIAFSADTDDPYGNAEIEFLGERYGTEHIVLKDAFDVYRVGEALLVPRSVLYRVNAKCKAMWHGEPSSRNTPFDATIVGVNKDGTYDLLYADEATDNSVEERHITCSPPDHNSESDRALSKKSASATVVAIDPPYDHAAFQVSPRLLKSAKLQTIIKSAKARERANEQTVHENEVAAQAASALAQKEFRPSPLAPPLPDLLVITKAVPDTLIIQYEDGLQAIIDLSEDDLTNIKLEDITRVETTVVPALVDAMRLIEEWTEARSFMMSLRRGRADLQLVRAAVLNNGTMASVYGNVRTLFELSQAMPTNSVLCETGISIVNTGKNKNQGRLEVQQLNDRTMVAMTANAQGNERATFPEFKDMDIAGMTERFVKPDGVERRSASKKRSHDEAGI